MRLFMAWSANEITTGSHAIFPSGMRVFVCAERQGARRATLRRGGLHIRLSPQIRFQAGCGTGKRILLDVGGDWCQYCHQMDQLLQEHPELLELRDKNFITVPVYYGTDKKNEQVLSYYPKVEGVPHFYVLDSRGSVLHSQHLLELRKGGKYDPDPRAGFPTLRCSGNLVIGKSGGGRFLESPAYDSMCHAWIVPRLCPNPLDIPRLSSYN
ncbi:MAG: hypothetical protein DMG79_03000 [Acidobacteria bacterium]|nr:MAG: hypothetical protein DMG79_03000 [Acidobacteriota bacterium]